MSQGNIPPWRPREPTMPEEGLLADGSTEQVEAVTSADFVTGNGSAAPALPPPVNLPTVPGAGRRFGAVPTPTAPHVVVRADPLPKFPLPLERHAPQTQTSPHGAPTSVRSPAPLPPIVPPPQTMPMPGLAPLTMPMPGLMQQGPPASSRHPAAGQPSPMQAPVMTSRQAQAPQPGHRPTIPMPSFGPAGTAAMVPIPTATAIRTDAVGTGLRPAGSHIVRSRAYSFVLDAEGKPVEIGSGRSAKAYLGEERWLESKTDFRRDVVIKILQKGVSEEDAMRFQMEKELVERVQGHPNIVHLFASGESDDPEFIPESIRDKIECEFMILERLEMSLEERLKGSRQRGKRDDLLAVEGRERIFRVLDYMIPIASALEYAHLVRNVCHRDLKPANVLIRLPNPDLRGSTLEVRLADFNVAKVQDSDFTFQMTRAHMQAVPGTLFFQSPEQETNVLELLVNVTQGSPEVEFFEDFYIQIEKNDTFVLFNHNEAYPILYADRAKKKVMLGQPFAGPSESSVRAKVQKSVGRPADIYSIGALFYYLISGAYANPKTLYDNFHKFIEYERADELNTVRAYLEHEYSVINSLRAPKAEQGADLAPADRFFSYKHYLDGNGDLIDPNIMSIIARCMIRNKPDSYCQAHDIETQGISDVVGDMIDLYTVFGLHPSAQPATLGRLAKSNASHFALGRSLRSFGSHLWWKWVTFLRRFKRRR